MVVKYDGIYIDKTSNRFMSMYRKSYTEEYPEWLECEVIEDKNLLYNTSKTACLTYIYKYKGLEDIALRKILKSKVKHITKLKVIMEVLNDLDRVSNDLVKNMLSQIKQYIKNIKGLDMKDVKELIEEIEERLSKLKDVIGLDGDDVSEEEEGSSTDTIAELIEDLDTEEILAALKEAGIKFRATAKLKGLEGEDLLEWILALIEDDKADEETIIEALEGIETSEDSEGEDEEGDDTEEEDEDEDDEDAEDDEDDEDDEEDSIDDLEPEELLELAETADIEVSKRLAKAIEKGSKLSVKLKKELEELKAAIKEAMEGEEDEGDDDAEDEEEFNFAESLKVALEEHEGDLEDLIEELGFEEDIEVDGKLKKLAKKPEKLAKELENLLDDETLDAFVEELEEYVEELEED